MQAKPNAAAGSAGNAMVKINKKTGKPIGSHGGARPGAGRRKGGQAKIHRVQHYIQKYPTMPLDHMLQILNAPIVPQFIKDPNKPKEMIPNPEFIPDDRRDWAAQAAAPYLHAKLASVSITGDQGTARHSIDITKLDDEELIQLERLISKSQIITLDEDEYEEVNQE